MERFTPQVTPQAALTELEVRMLAEIRKNRNVSRRELAGILGIAPDTVKEYIEKLKHKGVLKRVGKTSAGHWEVVE